MVKAIKKNPVGNMLIAQSGGPTMVINQSLIGAVQEAVKRKEITGVFGSLHGIQGILDENFIDLGRESNRVLEQVAVTPSSSLGTIRRKPTEEDCEQIFAILKKYEIRYFFYVGGNDSAETTYIINQAARKNRYAFRCFHI